MTPPPSSSSSSSAQRQPDLSEQRLTADYTLRNLQQQLVAVTGQADLKASIVITASSITLSLAISRVNDERLRPGVITLAAFVLTALVFAIFAVLPKYRLKGRPPTGEFNPFFFGHAALLEFEEYDRLMRTVIADQDRLYDVMLRDLHAQSTYLLRRKFRPLRWAYVFVIAGFVAAIVVQVVAELLR